MMHFESYTFPSRRSNVLARRGAVAASQPLAAQAGLRVLQAGGNAVDAAVATAAALCVVEPCSTGIGGDAFALIWQADERRLYGLNASGPAPAALTSDHVRALGYDAFPTLGGLTVTVPGSIRGWEAALSRFGRRDLDSVLAPAIELAADGFPVSQRIARNWALSTEKMSSQPDSKRVWLPGGRSPRAGELFHNPEVAVTLRAVADQGGDAFYRGRIAEQIVATVQADGGLLTLDDLAVYDAEWVTPISVPFGDRYRFYEIPPNGQGLTALLALNLAATFDLPALGYGTADYYHALLEAMKLAFADAAAFIGDPRHVDVPVDGLLSDAYSTARRAEIDMDHAALPTAGAPDPHGDTVYFSVADGEGNMVSWIQSLYMGFGSGLTAGRTGVQLQNRAANFVLTPGHPNEAGPGRRPYHTIIPGFITRDGDAWSSFGVMGGFMQPQGHLQVGLNLVAFGMDPQTALDAPRWRWFRDRDVAVESAVDAATRAALADRGHVLIDHAPTAFGNGQVIVRDPDSGVLIAGSEPRTDGMAVGW